MFQIMLNELMFYWLRWRQALTLPETDSGCSYRETQAQSPLDGLPLSHGNVLEMICRMAFDYCGTETARNDMCHKFFFLLLLFWFFFFVSKNFFPLSCTCLSLTCTQYERWDWQGWRAEPQTDQDKDKRQRTVGLVNVRHGITALAFSAELALYQWRRGIRYVT